ncbi:MAG: hypothetical protein QHC67_09045 [Sphingobium sp.]|uniref:hypothetical protein n=1 Tax=Sphingobium sp. TaxID=1912891 RepID=UPI0029BAD4D4|nr:hypothetical protein [Sphingobium sp.]MDX3909953.1 hypothetical protein [Sphingobium sp.]
MMIRKLILAAAAVFVGKKLIDAQGANGSSIRRPSGEHVPTDLMTGVHPGPNQRAPEAFRPDPHAPSSPEEREAMRPVTLPIRH